MDSDKDEILLLTKGADNVCEWLLVAEVQEEMKRASLHLRAARCGQQVHTSSHGHSVSYGQKFILLANALNDRPANVHINHNVQDIQRLFEQ